MQLLVYLATHQEQALCTYLFFGPSEPSAMHSVEWMKKCAKMVIKCRTKSQSNNWKMALGAGCQVGEASERGFHLPGLFTQPYL